MKENKAAMEEVLKPAPESSISKLDFPILVNILSRLDFNTILICKCVCKSWLILFSDPYFADTHFNFSSDSCILLYPFVMKMNPTRKIPFKVIRKDPNVLHCQDTIVKFDKKAAQLCEDSVMIVGSCDGLVCLSFPKLAGAFCVCNPISGEYMTVFPKLKCDHGRMMCFGLSPDSNKYKIVLFTGKFGFACRYFEPKKTYLFTVGIDSDWRYIGDEQQFLPGGYMSDQFNVFFNGSVHWAAVNVPFDDPKLLIRCFDFDREDFRVIPPPKEFGSEFIGLDKINLGVIDDCLSLCDCSVDGYIDIWVMKEYGAQESWMKKLVISDLITNTIMLKRNVPFRFLDDKESLVFSKNRSLYTYNMKQKQLTKDKIGLKTVLGSNMSFSDMSDTMSAKVTIIYKPCFILLEEIAKRQSWKLVNIQRRIG